MWVRTKFSIFTHAMYELMETCECLHRLGIYMHIDQYIFSLGCTRFALLDDNLTKVWDAPVPITHTTLCKGHTHNIVILGSQTIVRSFTRLRTEKNVFVQSVARPCNRVSIRQGVQKRQHSLYTIVIHTYVNNFLVFLCMHPNVYS